LAACRAAREKGIAHLLRAFDRLDVCLPVRPVLVYVGDGPQLPELRAIRESLESKDDVVLTGYRRDVATLLEGAALCVVPSVWHDAFPTSVLEALLRARPVVATRVGGIPEMVVDGVTGLLVEPGDEAGLAAAMRSLLLDPSRAEQLGQAGRQYARERFSPEEQIRQLAYEIELGFGSPCAEASR
jgi:glycosyltransferase involved in cell wall biosynthesis